MRPAGTPEVLVVRAYKFISGKKMKIVCIVEEKNLQCCSGCYKLW